MKETESKDSYSHILKYTGLFGGVQGLNILVSLIRNKLVAVLLGPNGMGLVALFNSVIAFVSQATSLGISFSSVRHVSEIFETGDEERIAHFIKVVRVWSLLSALLGVFVCIIIGPILNSFAFSWGDHAFHFILLSPVVGMTAITGGETAILKGCRRLRALAVVQVWTMLTALIISIPIYYYFDISGIIPVLVLGALVSMLITVAYSYRFYPLRLSGVKGVLGEGMSMVRLGVAFVLGGMIATAAELVIRSFLNVNAGLELVGLYNAGYMLTITYAGMVFTAMETEYYPRLSAVNHDEHAVNQLVNRQIEVSLLIISPMLTVMILLLPVIVPLLFTDSFMPVVPMAQLAVLAMFFKAITLPVAYINLAKGNSFAFLFFEILYAVAFVILLIVGFNKWGLFGTGVALVAVHMLDYVVINVYASTKYHYRISRKALRYTLIFLPLGCIAYAITYVEGLFLHLLLATMVSVCSILFSIYVFHKNTSLFDRLKERLHLKKKC